MSVKTRIEKGMELLDRVKPGWEHRIDLDILDLWSKCGCVLGQEFGHVDDALDDMGMSWPSATAHGFEIDLDTTDNFSTEYRDLTNAWKRAIVTRRQATSARAADQGAVE